MQLHEIPSLQSIYTLDAAVSKVQVSLDEHFSKVAAETDPQKSSEVTKNLLPATLQLIDTYASFTRWAGRLPRDVGDGESKCLGGLLPCVNIF